MLTQIEIETLTMVKSTCKDLKEHLAKKRKMKTFVTFERLEKFVEENKVSVEDIKYFGNYVLIYT